MAGALLGACADTPPPGDPLDSSYLLGEAARLVAISRGDQVDNHQYPDTLTWSAPQIQADSLVINEDQLAVEGLGFVKRLGGETTWAPRKDFGWQWVRTDFGQTLLIKRRPDLSPMKPGNTRSASPASQRKDPDPIAAKSDGLLSPSSRPSQPDQTLNAKYPQEIISRRTRQSIWGLVASHRIKSAVPLAFEAQGFTKGARPRSKDRWEGDFWAYDNNIDWADPDQAKRALRVFEMMLSRVIENDLGALRRSLEADGYTIGDNGLIRKMDTQTLTGPTRSQLSDPAAFEEYCQRLLMTSSTDPLLAIRCSGLLMRSAAKYVLEELGGRYNDEADLIELVELAQKALNIHSQTIPSNPEASETMVRTLSHLSNVGIGMAELLNQSQSHPTKDRPTYSLKSRHVRLAVEGGRAYCLFLLDTLRERRGKTE
jgi:hypothetical protein